MEVHPEYNRILVELEQAESARSVGNEGMARVCARRAAGIAAGVYISRNGYQFSGTGAYDRLKYLCEIPGISPEIKSVAEHFLVRVTPDHTLPIEADLIEEARWLTNNLLDLPQKL